jgi:hypothetical protein
MRRIALPPVLVLGALCTGCVSVAQSTPKPPSPAGEMEKTGPGGLAWYELSTVPVIQDFSSSLDVGHAFRAIVPPGKGVRVEVLSEATSGFRVRISSGTPPRRLGTAVPEKPVAEYRNTSAQAVEVVFTVVWQPGGATHSDAAQPPPPAHKVKATLLP